jgi:hypothetical protein
VQFISLYLVDQWIHCIFARSHLVGSMNSLIHSKSSEIIWCTWTPSIIVIVHVFSQYELFIAWIISFKCTRLIRMRFLICQVVQGRKNYLNLLANWMQSKTLICQVVQGHKNYLHLSANWVHSKTFICYGVRTYKKYLCTLVHSMHSKPSFVEVFKLVKITYIFWGIECMSKA